jgi:hypothetical protein
MGMDQYLYATANVQSVRQLAWEGPWCYYLRKNYWLNEQIEKQHPDSFRDRCMCSTVDITDDLHHLTAKCAERIFNQFEDGGCEYEMVYTMAALAWAKAQVANGWRIFYTMDC